MKLRVGDKLEKFRKERELTQAELSKHLGMSSSAYSRLEQGETYATMEQLVRISEVLEVPVPQLLPDGLTVYTTSHESPNSSNVVFGDWVNQGALGEAERKAYEEKIALLEELLAAYRKLV